MNISKVDERSIVNREEQSTQMSQISDRMHARWSPTFSFYVTSRDDLKCCRMGTLQRISLLSSIYSEKAAYPRKLDLYSKNCRHFVAAPVDFMVNLLFNTDITLRLHTHEHDEDHENWSKICAVISQFQLSEWSGWNHCELFKVTQIHCQLAAVHGTWLRTCSLLFCLPFSQLFSLHRYIINHELSLFHCLLSNGF